MKPKSEVEQGIMTKQFAIEKSENSHLQDD
jgi:hypothetical protein